MECLVILGIECSLTVLNSNRVFVLRNDALIDSLVENIDLCGGELPRADTTFEKQIEFGESAAAWFGDAEVGVDDAESAAAGPELDIKSVSCQKILHVFALTSPA
jgi:hypothetical protein